MLTLLVVFLVTLSQAGPYQRLELQIDQSRYYSTIIEVGTPPQKQRVLVDTGSSALLIQCSQCKDCHKPQQFQVYNQKQSSTYSPLYCRERLCQQTFNYISGQSYKANSAYQTIRFSQNGSEIQALVNCVNKEANRMLPKNGIMGLGPNMLTSIVYKWFRAQNLKSNMRFGLCLAANGGYLEFGSQQHQNSSNYQQIEVSFAAFLSQDYYTKQFSGITFNGIDIFEKQIALQKGLTFDSGAPLSIIPNSSFSKVIKQINKICGPFSGLCSPLTPLMVYQKSLTCYQIKTTSMFQPLEEHLDSNFPSFELSVGKGSLKWKPREYFYMIKQQDNLIGCVNIYPIPEHEKYLLGVNWMINKKFNFDLLQQSMQIIFNYNCSQFQESIGANFKGAMLFFFCSIFLREKIVKVYRKYKFRKNQIELQETEHKSDASVEPQINQKQ